MNATEPNKGELKIGSGNVQVPSADTDHFIWQYRHP